MAWVRVVVVLQYGVVSCMKTCLTWSGDNIVYHNTSCGEIERLRTKPSRHNLWCIFLELFQLGQRTLITRGIPSIKLHDCRMVGMQRDLVLHMVGELEKRGVGIYSRDELAAPSPPFTSAVLPRKRQIRSHSLSLC